MAITGRRRKPPVEDETVPAPPAEGDAAEVPPETASNDTTESDGYRTDDEPRKPVHVASYLVARDTYVQASVWARTVQLADGTEFTAHDVSLRKRFKDAAGEWRSYYSFRGSELYAVGHAVSQANAWILETRAAKDCPF